MGWYAKQKARYEAKKAEPHESWGEMRERVKAEQVAKEPRQKAEPAKEDQTAKTVCPPVSGGGSGVHQTDQGQGWGQRGQSHRGRADWRGVCLWPCPRFVDTG